MNTVVERSTRILIVEDDPVIAFWLGRFIGDSWI